MANRRRRAALCVGACWLAGMMALSQPAFAQQGAAALLSRWVEAAPAAFDFVQEKHLGVLSHPIVSHGVVTRRPDQTILWRQTDPFDSAVLIGALGIESGDDRADAAMQGAVASIAGAVVDIFFGRLDHLAALFDVTALDGHVVLVPKDDLLSGVIDRIELDGSSWLSEITLVDKSGDYTTISLTPADTAFPPQ